MRVFFLSAYLLLARLSRLGSSTRRHSLPVKHTHPDLGMAKIRLWACFSQRIGYLLPQAVICSWWRGI